MTYPPYLRGEPSDVVEIASAARIVAALGGRRVRLTRRAKRSLVAGARSYGPVTGRWLLLPFASDLPGFVGDRGAVEHQYARPGWYADFPGASRSARISSTLTALDLLGFRRSSVAWLRSQFPVGFRRTPPPVGDFDRADQRARSELLSVTAQYVRLRGVVRLPVNLDTLNWLKVFDASVANLPAADLEQLVEVLLAGGVPRQRLNAALRRFAANQLPDGMFRDPSMFTGDPATTLVGLALERQAHERTDDPALASALGAVQRTSVGPADPGSDLVLAAALALAGGSAPSKAQAAPCATSARVGKQAVRRWQLLALACSLIGRRIATPRVTPWSVAAPEGAVAAARLVNALVDAGHNTAGLRWIEPPTLSALLPRPTALGNTDNLAEVLRAVRLLGGGVSPAGRRAVHLALDRAHGCPGYADLYRAVASDPYSCDLPTTFAVRQSGTAADLTPSGVP